MPIRSVDHRYKRELAGLDRPGRRDHIIAAMRSHPDLIDVATLAGLVAVIRDRRPPDRSDRALRVLLTVGLRDPAVAATLTVAFLPALTQLLCRRGYHSIEDLVAVCWLKLAELDAHSPATRLYDRIVGRVARRCQGDRAARIRIDCHENLGWQSWLSGDDDQGRVWRPDGTRALDLLTAGARPEHRVLDRLALAALADAVSHQVAAGVLDRDEWRSLIARRLDGRPAASATERARSSKIISRLRRDHPAIEATRHAA